MNWTPEMKRLCDAETKRQGLNWLCYDYHPDDGQCAACKTNRSATAAHLTQEQPR